MRMSDWSSVVCASDLYRRIVFEIRHPLVAVLQFRFDGVMTGKKADAGPIESGDQQRVDRGSQRLLIGKHAHGFATPGLSHELGRAYGEERVCQHGSSPVVAVDIKKNNQERKSR